MNIQTDNIQVSFGPKTILYDISLDIRNKEFVGIIGPNGSGKSTFLKCLYRVLQPNNGKIFFDGTEMSSLSHRDTALKMAVVAQHSTVNFDFSVLEMVLMGRSPYKGLLDRDQIDDYEIARHALAQVGLSDFESRSFNTLSGGEQQMLAMGRALMSTPKLLLLDEPSMGLAPIFIQEIFDIIQDIQKQGTTVLLIEQNANKALAISDRGYVLETGKIVLSGTGKELAASDEVRKAYLGG